MEGNELSLQALAARMESVERENELLRAELDRRRAEQSSLNQAEDAAPAAPAVRRRSARPFVAGLLVTLAVLLAPVAVLGTWVSWELRDTEQFVETFAPLAEDSEVQAAVIAAVVAEVDSAVDIDGLVSEAFGALESLDLPPRAAAALGLLEGPAATGIRSTLTSITERLVTSPEFASLWAQILHVAHGELIGSLEGSDAGAVSLGDDGALGIHLAPVIAVVKERLVGAGLGFASLIPEVDRVIVVAQSDQLAQLALWYPVAVTVSAWLPWAVLALLVGGVLVSTRRWGTCVAGGLGLAAVMALLGAGIAVGRSAFRGAVSSTQLSPGAASAVYDSSTDFIRTTALGAGALGVLVALVAFLGGPFPAAVSIRRAFSGGAGRTRGWADRHGAGTGAVGRWLYEQRVAVRVLIGVAVFGGIVLLRPLTVTAIVWVAVVGALVLVLTEIAQRPPGIEPEVGEPAVVSDGS